MRIFEKVFNHQGQPPKNEALETKELALEKFTLSPELEKILDNLVLTSEDSEEKEILTHVEEMNELLGNYEDDGFTDSEDKNIVLEKLDNIKENWQKNKNIALSYGRPAAYEMIFDGLKTNFIRRFKNGLAPLIKQRDIENRAILLQKEEEEERQQ